MGGVTLGNAAPTLPINIRNNPPLQPPCALSAALNPKSPPDFDPEMHFDLTLPFTMFSEPN